MCCGEVKYLYPKVWTFNTFNVTLMWYIHVYCLTIPRNDWIALLMPTKYHTCSRPMSLPCDCTFCLPLGRKVHYVLKLAIIDMQHPRSGSLLCSLVNTAGAKLYGAEWSSKEVKEVCRLGIYSTTKSGIWWKKSTTSSKRDDPLLKSSLRDLKQHGGWNKSASHMPGVREVMGVRL